MTQKPATAPIPVQLSATEFKEFIVELRIRRFCTHLLEILYECPGTTQREFVESWIERECKWDPDLRTIPTFVAKISQMARDACATLVLINVL